MPGLRTRGNRELVNWWRGVCHIILLGIFFKFMIALALPCFAQPFSSCAERGLLFAAMRRLLIAVAPLAAEQGL